MNDQTEYEIDAAVAEFGLHDDEGEAPFCPTCGLSACVGRFQSQDCATERELFVPLAPANPAAPAIRKCKRHQWFRDPYGSPDYPPDTIVCSRCPAIKNEAASRRGRLNKNRGNAIERELGKKLGMKRVGQFGGKDDLSNALFAAQVKSGGYFSERQWAWLKAIPVKAGQTQLLVIADTPGPGRKRRALVILDLDDWRELHGQIGADEP